jgi:hypothetical protein
MREASTTALTGEIQNLLISPHCRSALTLEVFKNGAYQVIDDLDADKGVDWTESGKKLKYANFALTPLAGTVRFNVNNFNGKYSTGSGAVEEDYFDNDDKIRLSAGYFLNSPKDEETTTLNLNDILGTVARSYFFRMEYNGGVVDLTASNNGTLTHFKDDFLPLYDSETYDDSTYTPCAYTVQTYDSGGNEYSIVTGFSVTSNSTNGKIYYRPVGSTQGITESQLTDWTFLSNTTNGTVSVSSLSSTKRYFQIAVVYDGISYSDPDAVSQIDVTIQSNIEFIYKSVYYLDTPSFDDPPAPRIAKVFCNGRTSFKRAINSDINVPDMSSSTKTPDELIKFVCDQVGIPYTAASIPSITGFSNINWADGLTDITKADKVLDKIMEKINTDNYKMWEQYDENEDENILYVQKQEITDLEADGAFSYQNYVNIGSSRKNNDKALQRLTIITDEQVVSAEEQLDQETITTTGDTVFSWTGAAQYKRFEADLPNNIRGTVVVTPTSATLTVTEITGAVVVTLYGNKWDSTAPTYEGEAISFNNQIDGKGVTSRSVNPFLTSDAECKTVAESFITGFEVPIQEAQGLRWPYLNLLPEINDVYLLWRRFFFDDNLYFVTKISHRWNNSNNPRQSTSFNLDDSGRNFSETSEFIYDDEPIPMKYDVGFLYDMGISTPQSTEAEVEAASIIINNVDFT